MPDRRRSRRWRARKDVTITRDGVVVVGLTENLSRGGVCVAGEFDPPLSVGDEVRLSFPRLDAGTFARAQVRWVAGELPTRAGLEFVTGFRRRYGGGD